MQRRAAAAYAAFFILVAAASYAMIGVAEEPTVSLEDPEYSAGVGDAPTIGGTTYTVEAIGSGTNEEGSLRSADLTWVNESARYTVEVETNATVPSSAVTWDGQSASETGEPYRLTVEDAAEPSSFTLRQEFNVSARLAEDPAVEDQTVTRSDGREYVVYRENGSTRPLEDYLPAPETRRFDEGETVQYRGNATAVASVSNESVTLVWTAPRTNSLSLEEGATTTIDGTQYVAHLPDNSTLELASDLDAYDREAAAVETFHERMNGLWGITIVSGLAAILLLALAYLPSRY